MMPDSIQKGSTPAVSLRLDEQNSFDSDESSNLARHVHSGTRILLVAGIASLAITAIVLLTRTSMTAQLQSHESERSITRYFSSPYPLATQFFLPSSIGSSQQGLASGGGYTLIGFYNGCDSRCEAEITAIANLHPSRITRYDFIDTSGASPTSSALMVAAVDAHFRSSKASWIWFGGDSNNLAAVTSAYASRIGVKSVVNGLVLVDGNRRIQVFTSAENLNPIRNLSGLSPNS